MEDMMSVDFDGPVDLVITDPCYLGDRLPALMNAEFRAKAPFKEKDGVAEPVFWAPMNGGLEDLGFTRSLMGYTVFGDWTCAVLRGDDLVGRLCSESGMYCVLRRDELEKAWPGFAAWHRSEGWKAAVVPGFSGTVRAVAARRLYAVNDGGSRKLAEDLSIYIEGEGKDRSMDFRTVRTGGDL